MAQQQRVQRRLAAILAADVSGYSRLTGADEEGTLERLRALRREVVDPLIAEHLGRIVKSTGDGLLAEFASVVDAVRSAVAIQRSIAQRNTEVSPGKRILFRIGVNLGDIVAEGDDLLGDGVNVAARLEGIAEPGGICLSEDAYRQVRDRLSEEFTDLGEKELKNIVRPVRVYSVETSSGASALASPASALEKSGSPRLSIVVLPFANLGGDAAQGYFVDAITDSLTTDLSRIPGLFVIARNTAFTYKDKAVGARQIGHELGVRYVMEGSVLTGDDRIRVNAHLIDAASGAHLWAERFDKPRAAVLDMQDEITARLARTIGIEMVAAEGRRAERERPDNMDAVDLVMRGRAILNRPPSVENVRTARALFKAALRLDDRNAEALVGLAESHIFEVRIFASTNPAERVRAAEKAINKALALAPDSAQAHCVRAEVLFLMRAPERAQEECELAIGLDRNLPWAHANAGLMKLMIGRCEETEPYIAEAIRLSPRDPAVSSWYRMMGITNVFLGRYDQATEQLRRSITLNPHIPLTHFVLAAALALAGRMTEAAEARNAGLVLDPNFSVGRYRGDRRSDNPVFLQQRERMYEGLRKAGVPEGR